MPIVKGGDLEVRWKEEKKITTTSLGVDVATDIIKLSLSSDLPESNEPYQLYWRSEELYQFLQKQVIYPFQPPPPCYMVDDIEGQVRLFNSREFVSSKLIVENYAERKIDDTFLRKHIFSNYQMSISEEYFNYLTKLSELTENVGSIFDTPKGLVRGNMISVNDRDEYVHGFFRAVQADTVYFAIWPGDLITKPTDRCEIPFAGQNCFGCPKGTFDRPSLFTKIN